jgi:hypothetical protein
MNVESAVGFFRTAILGDVKDVDVCIVGIAWFQMLRLATLLGYCVLTVQEERFRHGPFLSMADLLAI